MSATKVLGSSSPVETASVRTVADKDAVTVEVEGSYTLLAVAQPATYVPADYTYDSHTLASTGNGMGKLSVRGVKYESGSDFSPARTTFEVDMQEVTYDLVSHPHLSEVVGICNQWISDGCITHDGNYYTVNAESEEEEKIDDSTAIQFCSAYSAGIRNYVRYFPVISKVSVWKNPPGLTRNGSSFTGGSLPFSDTLGTFDTPPITLSGFSANNFFKSADRWCQSENKTWTRTEQWTYTPEGSTGSHAWIYQDD